MVTELRFTDLRQLLCNALLDNPIYYCGDTQLTLLPVFFGYVYPSCRIGAILAPQNGLDQYILVPDKIIFQ
ncbi:hypothetical protein SDC9_126983 [bioreactor metagenome]|uniref:Uncharacterized protein n=1 Tax=bioreactor metagenome TaxID=1076179 RepID=A0A645CS42_9ZZZZ